ncbi:rhomboid family intramembrane serine protease [Bosea minatitlanensis]|nr:rhomboid family intramembrane serine protease [Bosea minatitlanensis]MCT4492429.1 rhomboid family intramembrane serine protease [Bosea minatitlanensis]
MDGFFVHAPARRLAPVRGFGKCRGAMVFHDPRPPAREPAFNLPPVVVQLLAVLVLIQAGRSLLSDYNDYVLMSWLAFVPARLTLWLSPERLDDVVGALAQSTVGQDVGDRLQLVQLLLADGGVRLWTLLSYGFLHGSWLHLASNALWLAAFGSPVARRLGPGRFLNLMALSTIGGALLHWWSRDLDVLPLVGASAGISGATAAAIRFVFAPGLRFGTLGDDAVVRAIPAEPLGQLWRNSRALLFTGIWFATNILFGSGLVPIFGEETSIAWEAHIGGFLVGLLLFPLFDRGSRSR